MPSKPYNPSEKAENGLHRFVALMISTCVSVRSGLFNQEVSSHNSLSTIIRLQVMHLKLKFANGTLIGLGIGHAIYVGRAEDIEPYLWIFSLFLIILGTMNFLFIQRHG